jgi:hypothetical protein
MVVLSLCKPDPAGDVNVAVARSKSTPRDDDR